MNGKDFLLGLQEFWSLFSQVKSGVVGLVMLGLFIFVAIFGPLLLDSPDAASNWSNIAYWQDNPKAAAPVWTNWFAPRKAAETVRLGHGPVQDSVTGDSARKDYAFTYAMQAEIPPQDMIFRISGKGTAQAVISLKRPDGIQAELYRDNLDLGSTDVHRVTIRNNSDKAIIQMIRDADEYAASSIDINKFNPMTYLMAAIDENLADEPQTLKGDYVFTLSVQSRDASFAMSQAEVVVNGKVSGIFGTDSSKRDIFTGLVFGTRWALIIGLMTSLITVLVGVLLGVTAAYYGGIVDSILNRIYEYVYMLPVLPFLIVLSATYKPTIWTMIIIICLLFWTGPFKPVYSMALQIREEVFVEAAKALGARHRRILLRHIVPILLPYSFAVMALSIPGVIVYEASVSLLGLGDATIVTFGQILHAALTQNAVVSGIWWWVVPPGLLIALMGMSFAFLGSALDKVLHPKLKTR